MELFVRVVEIQKDEVRIIVAIAAKLPGNDLHSGLNGGIENEIALR